LRVRFLRTACPACWLLDVSRLIASRMVFRAQGESPAPGLGKASNLFAASRATSLQRADNVVWETYNSRFRNAVWQEPSGRAGTVWPRGRNRSAAVRNRRFGLEAELARLLPGSGQEPPGRWAVPAAGAGQEPHGRTTPIHNLKTLAFAAISIFWHAFCSAEKRLTTRSRTCRGRAPETSSDHRNRKIAPLLCGRFLIAPVMYTRKPLGADNGVGPFRGSGLGVRHGQSFVQTANTRAQPRHDVALLVDAALGSDRRGPEQPGASRRARGRRGQPSSPSDHPQLSPLRYRVL